MFDNFDKIVILYNHTNTYTKMLKLDYERLEKPGIESTKPGLQG